MIDVIFFENLIELLLTFLNLETYEYHFKTMNAVYLFDQSPCLDRFYLN